VNRSIRFLLAGFGLGTSLLAGQTTPVPADRLIGIWGSENNFGPLLRGELTVRRQDGSWQARLRGIAAHAPVRGDSVLLEFPGTLGWYRGALAPNGQIEGWWIQPTGVLFNQPFATRLTLARVRPGIWRGAVVPLDENFTLYLAVWRRSSDSALVGAFRNPEFNLRGPASSFRITLEGDSIRFGARPDTTQPELRMAAHFDPEQSQITIRWRQLGRTVVLTPRDTTQALGLFTRVPRGQTYQYAVPQPEADGWTTAAASTVGFDEAALARLVQRISDTTPLEARSPHIHSLLIARRGRLVLDEYFMGHDRTTAHDTRSAAKTYASVMMGAAMLAGDAIGPDVRLYPLVGEMGKSAAPDPRRDRITIGHLLTHTSGLACDDNLDDSPGNENTMQNQSAQPDWWRYTLELPMAFEPGSHYAYCSATMSLTGAALTRATRTWLPEYFDRTVARPLQFGPYYFNLQPTLEGYLAGGLRIMPRDLLKIGQVYLDGGTWHGRRIVSADWVRRSTMQQVADSTQSADGYAWHRSVLKVGDRTYREYEANGNGGQFVIVVPELELVVVFTAGNYMGYNVWRHFRDTLLTEAIIPAITNRP
jgi:CubicO group peptidase (beta-lactamase class C family)